MASHNYVAYYRTSLRDQCLGIEAQKTSVATFLKGGDNRLLAEFEEHESGKNNSRSELRKALSACKKHKATLIIAKLDRLSRSSAFINNLMESGVDFVACDNPHANKLTVRILAAVAQHEREQISSRTRDALAALKAQGKALGNRTNLSQAQAVGRAKRCAKATQFASNILPIVEKITASGIVTLRAVAAELNERNIPAPRGGEWSGKQVQLLLRRAQPSPSNPYESVR
ncbi:recombinase family protein [Microvirga calopogonii]|uniref:recombinase family protein n=1 Tax=Microvirga calopogonii TaxID=2078013 RepID=UPI000E0D3AAE|nr:recombinase family protein [Microvirga calopogonii]